MTWTGKRRWTASAFTYVPLGAVMVPTAIEFEFLGDVGEPDMSARFEMRAGRPECVELTIRARPQGRDIRTSDLEGVVDVGIDRMVETAFARLAVEPDADGNWTWTGNERDVDGNDARRAGQSHSRSSSSWRGSIESTSTDSPSWRCNGSWATRNGPRTGV